MAATFWVNAFTGNTLEVCELADLRSKARVVYAANGHIFEDEADALTALGAVPFFSLVA
jgi:threonine aldolase